MRRLSLHHHLFLFGLCDCACCILTWVDMNTLVSKKKENEHPSAFMFIARLCSSRPCLFWGCFFRKKRNCYPVTGMWYRAK